MNLSPNSSHAFISGAWPACLTERSRVRRAVAIARAREQGEEAACGIAEITVVGFEPTSPKAL